jgi:hypothetical protein
MSTVLLLVLSIGLAHCGSSNEPSLPVTLVKENNRSLDLGWTSEKSVTVSGVNYPSLFLNRGNLHVSGFGGKDKAGYEMIVVERFSRDLESLHKKYIPTGQGPGDLGSGPRFSAGGGFIYVSDNTQRRITVFTEDLEYVKMHTIKWHIFSTEFSEDGAWFLCSQTRSKWTVKGYIQLKDISIFTYPGLKKTLLEEHGPYNQTEPGTKKWLIGSTAGYHFFHRDDTVYFIDMAGYRIAKYDIKGQLQKHIRVEVEEKKVPPSKKREWMIAQHGNSRNLDRIGMVDVIQPASWMVPLGKGFVVVRRNSYETDCEGLVEGDYFNYDLEMKGKVRIPCFWFIFQLRRDFHSKSFKYIDGYLYLLADKEDDFRLEKWKITEI